MDILKTADAWVILCFPDSTVKTVHTTLNVELLHENGATPRVGYLYDIDRGTYIPFVEAECSVGIFTEKPKYDSEVLQFASRFI